ncbi:MAG: hypothetical protein IIB38_12535 [Candidatus Hydrogenedentes bacterium]|nr:hypothetical protein [Candidatus Hydrogenedentota bacterium]
MDGSLVVLKLFLDELGIDTKIESLNDRKRVQKAVYLGQLSGIDLGYRFGWYLLGPYSTSLARDYYELADEIDLGELPPAGRQLKGPIRERLAKIVPILEPPEGFSESPEDWLELLASYHYLLRIQKLDKNKTLKELSSSKPRLSPYADMAKTVLSDASLL